MFRIHSVGFRVLDFSIIKVTECVACLRRIYCIIVFKFSPDPIRLRPLWPEQWSGSRRTRTNSCFMLTYEKHLSAFADYRNVESVQAAQRSIRVDPSRASNTDSQSYRSPWRLSDSGRHLSLSGSEAGFDRADSQLLRLGHWSLKQRFEPKQTV